MRLLRRCASSVERRKCCGIDIIAVRVEQTRSETFGPFRCYFPSFPSKQEPKTSPINAILYALSIDVK